MKERITNRHMARLLSKLDFLDLPEIAREAIKSHMLWLSQDLEKYYQEREKNAPERLD
jgi:hypothetical protein